MRGSRTAPHACVVRRCCCLRTRSCLVSRPRTLTDAMNTLYPCLPNHSLAKGVGGGPHFQVDSGLLLEILESEHGQPSLLAHSFELL